MDGNLFCQFYQQICCFRLIVSLNSTTFSYVLWWACIIVLFLFLRWANTNSSENDHFVLCFDFDVRDGSVYNCDSISHLIINYLFIRLNFRWRERKTFICANLIPELSPTNTMIVKKSLKLFFWSLNCTIFCVFFCNSRFFFFFRLLLSRASFVRPWSWFFAFKFRFWFWFYFLYLCVNANWIRIGKFKWKKKRRKNNKQMKKRQQQQKIKENLINCVLHYFSCLTMPTTTTDYIAKHTNVCKNLLIAFTVFPSRSSTIST